MEAAKVEGFSDGVFAVAMTLLIYQVVTPHFEEGKSNSELLKELGKLWPYYLSLFISFFTILIMWINHHNIFKLVHRIDSRFMFANGFLLFLVIIVPYPTLLVSQFLLTPSAKAACAVYAGVFLVINLAYNWLWFAASHKRKLLIATITDKKIKLVTKNYLTGLPMYSIAFAVAFINAYVSLAICMLLWAYWAAIIKLN
jgi:uncharacterized membrane protein